MKFIFLSTTKNTYNILKNNNSIKLTNKYKLINKIYRINISQIMIFVY